MAINIRNSTLLASVLALGLFAFLTMGMTFLFFYMTEEPIQRGQFAHRQQILASLASSLGEPGALQFNPRAQGYDIVKAGAKVGVIIAATTPAGYGGSISMLAALANNGTLLALRITQHAETPGLGDKIDSTKSDWIYQFDGRPPSTVWRLRQEGGDFDALTGATITSRAVVRTAAKIVQTQQ